MGLRVDDMCLFCNKKALVCCLTCKRQLCMLHFIHYCFITSGNIVTTDGLGIPDWWKNERTQ